MNIIEQIEKQYLEINKVYNDGVFTARALSRPRKEAEWEKKKVLNDHAYFLFMFTRLEEAVRKSSSNLIAKKKASIPKWFPRAVWDILPSNWDSDELNFRKRAMLILDKNSHVTRAFGELYGNRNAIAHGETITIDMPTEIAKFKAVYKNMKKFK